jgi:hypothetical protein
MLNLDNIVWRDHPYRIGLARPVFEPALYDRLVQAYPDEAQFYKMGTGYNKLSLSERFNASRYHQLLDDSPTWQGLYTYIKSPSFIEQARLAAGLPRAPYTSRFEFSSMPANSGMIAPHTDIPSKVLTLIIPVLKPGEWQAEWGGGTDVLEPLDPQARLVDYQAPLEMFRLVASYPYAPNQACVFLKSHNSWHSVGPIQGPAGRWRRSLTINLEKSS